MDIKLEEGKIYKIKNKKGIEFVGFYYKPKLIVKFLNRIFFDKVIIDLRTINKSGYLHVGELFIKKEIESIKEL